MSNLLDIKKNRRASPQKILESVSLVQEEYDRLLADFDRAPSWPPPDRIADLTDEELNESIYMSARIYGHYAKIAESCSSLLRGLKTAVSTFVAALRSQVYAQVSDKEIKEVVAQDSQVLEANRLLEALDYLHGKADGERKQWSSIKDALSRCVELRREGIRKPKAPLSKPRPVLQTKPGTRRGNKVPILRTPKEE